MQTIGSTGLPELAQQSVHRMLVIPKGHVYNFTATANANIFGVALQPTAGSAIFRIDATVNLAGKITVVFLEGTGTMLARMNNDTNLVASAFYSQEFMVYNGQSINVRFDQAAVIANLTVVEKW